MWEVISLENAFVANERKDPSELCKIGDVSRERYMDYEGECDGDFEIN